MPQFVSSRHNAAALLTVAAVLVLGGDLWGEEMWGHVLLGDTPPMALAMFVVALAVTFFVMFRSNQVASPRESRRVSSLWIVPALVLHLGLALVACCILPANNIDTYTIQTEAARELLHGHDPYGQTHANTYSAAETPKFYGSGVVVDGRVQVGLMYPPATLLWTVPGYWLGDIRYSFILAILLSGALLFALAPNAWGFGLTLFLLLNPFTFWVENRCWTEPFALLTLTATLFAAKRFPRWLPLAFGLLLANKQYNLVAAPLVAMLVMPFSLRKSFRLLISSGMVAVATFVPFVIWNARGLFHDLVLFHLKQPYRVDALSFAVPFPAVLKFGPILVVAFLAIACWKLRGTAMFAASFGAAVLLFFITGKQAAANYFFLAAFSFVTAAVVMCSEDSAASDVDGASPSLVSSSPAPTKC
jgi:hypothetical protein